MPAKKKVEEETADALKDAGVEPQDLESAIAAVIHLLGYAPEEVSQLDISRTGNIRVFGTDRSLRTKKFGGWRD